MAHGLSTAWLVVLAYVIGALLCFVAYKAANEGRERHFWIMVALILVLLGLNKKLDFQTYLTAIGRDLATAQGWYEWRRQMQLAFLLLLGLGATTIAVALLRWLRGLGSSIKVAVTGLLVLTAFVLVRAATFLRFDFWVPVEFADSGLVPWLELIGTGVVAAAAASFWLTAARRYSH